MANKIKYGIKNVYYAVATEGVGGVLSYATPVALPGAVSLSLDAQGDTNTFYADNIAYYTSTANNGYSGDLELALLPDEFRTDVLGEVVDENDLLVELSNTSTVEFALLFQFEGDDLAARHCLYRCTASRPSVSGSTKEESIEPQTESVTITAMPRINDEVVKSKCLEGGTGYSTWFTAVVEPDFTP